MNRIFTALLLLGVARAQGESGLPRILALAGERAEAFDRAVGEMTWQVHSVMTQWNDPKRLKPGKVVLTERLTRLRKPDLLTNTVLAMTIDGKRLSPDELARELKKPQPGGPSGVPENPLSPKARARYDFEWKGEERVEGRKAIRVGFTCREISEKYYHGEVLIFSDTGDQATLTLWPSKLPRFLTSLRIHVVCAPYAFAGESWWLGRRMDLDLRVEVKFLVSLADIRVTVTEFSSEHRFVPPAR
jgi:hypothetical protein